MKPRSIPTILAALVALPAVAQGTPAVTTETVTLPRAPVTRPEVARPAVTPPEVARPERPRVARPAPPLPLPPPPAPPVLVPYAGWDAAPVPNREIEAPPDRFARPARTTLEPTIIEPYERRRGFTFGREHAPDRTERLFNEIAPGARLRIPLD
ncbi:hypothetical protein G3576_08950 [Roseomonas stagni]|uniref:Uncharacterized protein n=1 Tax=Falsiroseomonas algicola TaxID=2716930 RepID=A0A6M1LJH9_9PROT|nr:hypothetical protein [Falsiroseomonas algicola]NGM20139.1 hypothetical protein [Falsiroseomonas algicola]